MLRIWCPSCYRGTDIPLDEDIEGNTNIKCENCGKYIVISLSSTDVRTDLNYCKACGNYHLERVNDPCIKEATCQENQS